MPSHFSRKWKSWTKNTNHKQHSLHPPCSYFHALIILASCTWNDNISFKHYPKKSLKYKSPTQILYHWDPTYTHLLVFGCLCYLIFPSTTINKLQSCSTPCVFSGYPYNHRGYKCYALSSQKIIILRHVIFYESQFSFAKLHTPFSTAYEFLNYELNPILIHKWKNRIMQPPQSTLPMTDHSQANPSRTPIPLAPDQATTQTVAPLPLFCQNCSPLLRTTKLTCQHTTNSRPNPHQHP